MAPFGGYFGVEFRNITFTGERAAAEKTLAAYQVYERDDRHIRALNRGGNLRAAIAFDTSYAPGNSNWAFTQYDNALVGLIAINQRAFDGAISAGQQDMNGWTGYIPAAAAVLIVVLVLAGVPPGWPNTGDLAPWGRRGGAGAANECGVLPKRTIRAPHSLNSPRPLGARARTRAATPLSEGARGNSCIGRKCGAGVHRPACVSSQPSPLDTASTHTYGSDIKTILVLEPN